MKYLSILGLAIVLSSCLKRETCTARTADGESKYETAGRQVCQDQIYEEYGEYCDCD